MRVWSYITVGFIFNYILLKFFPLAGEGASIGLLITIPIIALICILFTIIHYILIRKKVNVRYFIIFGLLFITSISYSLFISEPGNSPFAIIKRMIAVKTNYDQISINDYFKEQRCWNYEKIVAAKKKFGISDTSYSVRITNHYKDKTYSNYGIFFKDDFPLVTKTNVKIELITPDFFKFIDIVENDTFIYFGNKSEINPPKLKIDDFTNYGTGYKQDLNMKDVNIEKRIINKNPDDYYFIYKLFYWIL